jgi:hypothetical protein
MQFAKQNGESAFAMGKDLAAAIRPSADRDLCSSSTGVRASHGGGGAELCTSEPSGATE